MPKSKKIFIEERPDGMFAVTRQGAQRASALCNTETQAIKRAKQLEPGSHPDVERVRHTSKGTPPHWRSATRKPKK